jgi:DNA-nicking Smr family endonuclease
MALRRRFTSDEERQEFERHIRLAQPVKPARTKPAKTKPPIIANGPEQTKAASAKRDIAPSGHQLNRATEGRLKKGSLEPDSKLDLHGLTQAAAHRALLSFLAGAHARGHRLVLVVTGKGNPKDEDNASWMTRPHGVLKEMVPRWLGGPECAALIAGVRPAHLRHGGAGALYVYLRRKR